MSLDHYLKAQKLGLKAYKTSISEGNYPYLPVLDEILSHADIDREVSLGISYIPLELVVGTSTKGRTQAFASNFMPLLNERSEFSMKWSTLCTAQLEEGIHDAVKVYEYMNKYYVVEGNKRVSVLKYFDAATILAEVIRKVPKKSNDPQVRNYYEYINFYDLTQINFLTFSKPGSYPKLLTVMGKSTTDIWAKEDCLNFSYFYAQFHKAFVELGGRQLTKITTGDALLLFLNLYPYNDAMDQSETEIKECLEKIWPEIILLGEEDSIELLMNPIKNKTTVTTVLNKIKTPRQKRIAFVYDKAPASSDWIYNHELGRLHLLDVFDQDLETTTYVVDLTSEDADDKSAEVLEKICLDGYHIIFTVTPKLINACLKVAVNHPQTIILNCALNSSFNSVRTYYTRMYEAKFLTGMIAGALCTNQKIGYVADYPLYGAAASINAFALGAKMVNPYVSVYLAWSTLKNFDVDQYFEEQNIAYVSAQDMITPQNDIRQFGLYEKTEYGKKNLAMSICNWGVFYEKLIHSIQKGAWKAEETIENKAINYWWGLSAGVIDVICSQHLPAGTAKLVELMKQAISSGSFHPFTGPLKDQNGIIQYNNTVEMKPEDIMKMDWLVDNVIGKIPNIDELKEEAQPVVLLRGLHAATAEDGGNLNYENSGSSRS